MAKSDTKNLGKSIPAAVTPRAPKFRRRSEARPDEVLDAALALFVEKGFAATRVEDIAKRAGLSKGAVYLYFPSKEAVLEGLVRRAIVPVAEHALAMLGKLDGHPRDMMTFFLRTLATRLEDPKFFAIPKIILREAVVAPQLAAIYRNEVLSHAIPAVTQLIERGIAAGQFRPVNAEMAVRSVVGPIIAHVMLGEVFGIKPADDYAIDALIETHLTILFDGLSMPEGAQ